MLWRAGALAAALLGVCVSGAVRQEVNLSPLIARELKCLIFFSLVFLILFFTASLPLARSLLAYYCEAMCAYLVNVACLLPLSVGDITYSRNKLIVCIV